MFKYYIKAYLGLPFFYKLIQDHSAKTRPHHGIVKVYEFDATKIFAILTAKSTALSAISVLRVFFLCKKHKKSHSRKERFGFIGQNDIGRFYKGLQFLK